MLDISLTNEINHFTRSNNKKVNEMKRLHTLQLEHLKLIRCILGYTGSELARKLGCCRETVDNQEHGRNKRSLTYELALKFLLVEAGLYAHFRLVYLNKTKIRSLSAEDFKVRRAERKARLKNDALAFKYKL